jgi:hypothetical protein
MQLHGRDKPVFWRRAAAANPKESVALEFATSTVAKGIIKIRKLAKDSVITVPPSRHPRI